MGVPQNKYVMAKLQWYYVDELIALGYDALRERSGKDTVIELAGPDERLSLIHTDAADEEGSVTRGGRQVANKKKRLFVLLTGTSVIHSGCGAPKCKERPT